MLDTFIQEFAREMEIGHSLPISASGTFELPLDEGLSVQIEAIPEGFKLFSNIAVVPETNKETFLQNVMLGNLFGQGTHGAVLGMSEDGSQLTLSKKIDYTYDYSKFRETLEEFINTIDFWRDEAMRSLVKPR
jgi:hypothetical protein